MERGNRLTNQLLTFAKGGAPEIIPLQLANFVATEAEFAAAGSELRFQYRVEDDLWAVAADPGQLAQVVQNLVVNAIHATDGKGSIEVSLRNVDVEVADGPRSQTRRHAELEFTDDGPGIPLEIRDRIFDVYFSTKGSSGLGLAIMQSIVHRHGGSVSVDPSKESGATFTIRLPAWEADAVDSDDESAVPEVVEISGGSSLRALVMEDDDSLRLLIRDLFTALGHQVDVARDGDEVLQLFQMALNSGTPHDVAVLDVTIQGGMGGHETGSTLLELKPDLPILLMSGYHEVGFASGVGDAGFRGFLRKPFGLDALRNALQTVLN